MFPQVVCLSTVGKEGLPTGEDMHPVGLGRHPPRNYKSGRYASCWNAFWFETRFLYIKIIDSNVKNFGYNEQFLSHHFTREQDGGRYVACV